MASQDIEIKIKTALDTLGAAKSLSDYKKSLRELKGLGLETGDSNSEAFNKIRTAIGETNDKIADFNAIIKSSSGEPIENLTGSFQGLVGSIKSLDFKSAKAQFGVLTDSAKQLGGQVLGGFNVFGNFNKAVAAGQGPLKALSTSFQTLGKSIMATGIGALAIAVVLLISNFDKLKESGGALGIMFTAIGDVVQFVMDKLIELSDWLGLTDIQNQERSKNIIAAAEKEKKVITDRYDAEIAKAEAAGKSTDDLVKKKNAALAFEINQQIKQLANKKTLNDEEKKQLEGLYADRNALVLANEIVDIKAQKAKEDRDKTANEKAIAEQKKKNDKAKADAEKHEKEVQQIKDQYLLTEREKLAKKFDDDMAKLNQKNADELKLYNELNAKKLEALTAFDKKVQDEKDAKDKEEKDKQKEKDDAAFEANKKRLEDENLLNEGSSSASLKKQLDFLNLHYKELGMTENEYKVAKAKLEEDITKKEKEENDKRDADAKAKRDAKFQMAQDLVNGLSALNDLVSTIEMSGLKEGTAAYEKAARRKFAINKALQLSTAIITGIQSVMSAYASGMTPPLGNPATATFYAITAGLAAAANVAKIAASQYKSSGSGGGGGGNTGGSAPEPTKSLPTPPPAMTMTAAQTIGLGTTPLQTQRPNQWQKVYVTESDIRQTTNKVEVIEARSVLGS